MGNCYSDQALLKQSQEVPLFSLEGNIYRCKIVSVYDGDTCTAIFKLNGKYSKFKIRMQGYDSPEMKPRLNTPNREEEKKQAVIAKNALINETNDRVIILKCGKWDKYGRLLGTLYKTKPLLHSTSINQWMIDNNFGYPYDGGKKRDFDTI